MDKKLLILDLDETLFYASEPRDWKRNDEDFDILDVYPTIERPHVHKFLKYAFDTFNVAVWSSAGQNYVTDAVRRLITHNKYGELMFVYDDTNCVRHRPAALMGMPYHDSNSFSYLKDLKKLKKFGVDKTQTIVIDDSPWKWSRNYGNLIRIPSFRGNMDDDYLLRLIDFLEVLKDEPNIRTVEKRGWYIDK